MVGTKLGSTSFRMMALECAFRSDKDLLLLSVGVSARFKAEGQQGIADRSIRSLDEWFARKTLRISCGQQYVGDLQVDNQRLAWWGEARQ